MTQYPVVLMPDATAVAVEILNDGLATLDFDITAYDAVPSPRPGEFITVRRTGGARNGPVHDRPQITVESWAATTERAHDVAQAARAVLRAATGTVVAGTPVGRIEEASGPGELPDPISDQPRWTQTFIVALRGAPPS